MSDTKEEVMTTRRTRLSALKSEENSHCNDGSGDEIVRRDLFVVVNSMRSLGRCLGSTGFTALGARGDVVNNYSSSTKKMTGLVQKRTSREWFLGLGFGLELGC